MEKYSLLLDVKSFIGVVMNAHGAIWSPVSEWRTWKILCMRGMWDDTFSTLM